jgi:hypothetical protein
MIKTQTEIRQVEETIYMLDPADVVHALKAYVANNFGLNLADAHWNCELCWDASLNGHGARLTQIIEHEVEGVRYSVGDE